MPKRKELEMPVQSEGLFNFLSKANAVLPEETVRVEFVVLDPETGQEERKKWDVRLRGFTSRERDLWEEDCLRRNRAKSGNGRKPSQDSEPDLANFRARLVARSIVEKGVRILWNDNGEEWLGNQQASEIDRLFSAAQRLHGMSDADVEAMAGNLDETEDAASSSVSPSPTDAPLPN